MSTKRAPINRRIKTQITPAAIDAYRRFRGWDGKCTCPPVVHYPAKFPTAPIQSTRRGFGHTTKSARPMNESARSVSLARRARPSTHFYYAS